MLYLNILITALGVVGSITAIGGDTWKKGQSPWAKRLTGRGWVALGCLVFAFGLGVAKEVRSNKESQAQAQHYQAREAALDSKLDSMNDLLIKLSLNTIQTAANDSTASSRFRATVREAGFTNLVELLYQPGRAVLNLRSAPATSAPVISQIPSRTPFRVLETQSRWVRVAVSSGETGWVVRSLIRPFQ